MTTAWCAKYVGICFCEHGRSREGCDCWGLVRLILEERFGEHVRDFSDCYANIEDAETIEALCRMEAEAWQRVEAPQPGDVVLLRMAGLATHVGLVVAPGMMIHILKGSNAVIESFHSRIWRHRVEGFYRHAG